MGHLEKKSNAINKLDERKKKACKRVEMSRECSKRLQKLVIMVAATLMVMTSPVRLSDGVEPETMEANESNRVDKISTANVATEFWEQIYQNSMLNTKSRYSVLNDERVCFTCPIDRTTFTSLYHEALDQSSSQTLGSMQSLPPLTITWAAQLNENRVIFFCRNNSRLTSSPVYLSGDVMGAAGGGAAAAAAASLAHHQQQQHGAQLDYSCESNRLCLSSVKSFYPKSYQCFVKSYILNVKLDVIGK